MRVLIVEDSTRLRETVSTYLRRNGFAVDSAADGDDGLFLAETNQYDVIILDLMLPGTDGISILKSLRKSNNKTSVLILTAKDSINDRVLGLETGADDYLVKPFALEELLARVKALCRRAYADKNTCIIIGDLEIDTVARKVTRAGKVIQLQPREYALLEYLARRRGHIVTRTEIEEHIYPDENDVMSNSVDSAICVIRRKLSEANPTPIIHTHRGLGYELSTK
ncbi:MAG TPA: response regulator transcription factor [Verrucomicrobiota bacterium]|nr:response regulator transcription factor [Verrucomicrobiota bacterium]